MKINYMLAILAMIGGLSAAFTNHTKKNNLYPTWKYDRERVDGEKVRYISATHLADLLYRKEPGITILDLRSMEAFETYHIPSAISHTVGEDVPVRDPESLVIIYGSAGKIESEDLQAFMDGKPYVLKGGIGEWYARVLFPDFLKFQIRNSERLDEIIRRTRYFGGTPKNMQLLNISVRESRYREGC